VLVRNISFRKTGSHGNVKKGAARSLTGRTARRTSGFFTVSDDYYFNVDAVMLKRQVIAPYTNSNGEPKDWTETENGRVPRDASVESVD
jgi:hypothetical protein